MIFQKVCIKANAKIAKAHLKLLQHPRWMLIIVNGWKPITIITKNSILDVAAVPDLLLDFKSNLKYVTAKDGLLTFKCLNKTYMKNFDEQLSETFESTCQFCDGDINKTSLRFQKLASCFREVLIHLLCE